MCLKFKKARLEIKYFQYFPGLLGENWQSLPYTQPGIKIKIIGLFESLILLTKPNWKKINLKGL